MVEKTPTVAYTPPLGPTDMTGVAWWWTNSVSITFSDPDVFAQDPDGVPKYGQTLMSGAPSPTPTPAPTATSTSAPVPPHAPTSVTIDEVTGPEGPCVGQRSCVETVSVAWKSTGRVSRFVVYATPVAWENYCTYPGWPESWKVVGPARRVATLSGTTHSWKTTISEVNMAAAGANGVAVLGRGREKRW